MPLPRSRLRGRVVRTWQAWALLLSTPFCTFACVQGQRATDTAELRLLLCVRDRLHLAEVMRALKRSPAVLRVGRVKP